jgi:hypothetical protein
MMGLLEFFCALFRWFTLMDWKALSEDGILVSFVQLGNGKRDL